MVKKNKPAKREVTKSDREIGGSKPLEETRQASESALTTIFNIVGMGILVIDTETLTILEVNQTAADIIGRTKEKIVGHICHSFICPAEAGKCPIKDLGQSIDNSERKIICADGQRRDILKNVSPLIIKGRKCYLEIFIDITERRMVEEALKKSEERYRFISDNTADVIWTMDSKLRYTYISPSVTRQRGYTIEEASKLNLTQVLTPESQDTILKKLQVDMSSAVDGQPRRTSTFTQDMEMYRKDGTTIWSETSVTVLRTPPGEFDGLLGISRDITERKQAEESLLGSEEKYRSLVENINDIFYILDRQGNFTYISPVVERLTKYKVSELIGKPIFPLIHPDDLPGLLDSYNQLVSGQLAPRELRWLDKDGRVIFVRVSRQLLYKDGKAIGVTAVVTDITERKQMEQKLEEMATHDFLTGLPNRVLLLDRFNMAAALSHRNKARLAVMSLDLDRFKSINDTLGHDAGDQVLKSVSARLTGIIRASDTLARVGGDEFILVMMGTNHAKDATAIAQKILDSFTEPLSIDGHQLHLSTSIGIAIYPEDAQDMETLTKKSDAAMYYSKGHGRNQFKFFGDGDVRISGDHRSAPN